jgi:hypothetical protein
VTRRPAEPGAQQGSTFSNDGTSSTRNCYAPECIGRTRSDPAFRRHRAPTADGCRGPVLAPKLPRWPG